jgi:hypothetical protein
VPGADVGEVVLLAGTRDLAVKKIK